jgi:hypothetical protein
MGLKSIPLAKIIFDFFFFSRQKERSISAPFCDLLWCRATCRLGKL